MECTQEYISGVESKLQTRLYVAEFDPDWILLHWCFWTWSKEGSLFLKESNNETD